MIKTHSEVQVTDAELLDHLDAERMKGFGAAMRVTTMTFHVPAHMTFREYVTVQIGRTPTGLRASVDELRSAFVRGVMATGAWDRETAVRASKIAYGDNGERTNMDAPEILPAAARAVAHPPNDNLLRRMAAVEATNGVDVGMPPGAVVLTDQMDSPFPCVKCGRDTGKDAQRLYGAVCHPTCESRPTSAGQSTGGESNAGE
jgi:hypothetical protein